MRLLFLLVVSCAVADDNLYRPQMVVFGDSVSDTGNRHLQCDCVDTAPFYVAPAPLGPYEQHSPRLDPRFTNGKVWAEYLLGTDNFVNYAIGDARARDREVNADDLPAQVSRYLTDVSYTIDPDTVHVLMIGILDIYDAVAASFKGDTPLASQIIEDAVGAVADTVSLLYGAGARRFYVPNLFDAGLPVSIRYYTSPAPPAGETPQAAALATSLTAAYNDAFSYVLAQLSLAPGVTIATSDLFGLSRALYDSGDFITDSSCLTPLIPIDAVCEDPNDYMFYDGLHPTSAVHRNMASEARKVFRAAGFLRGKKDAGSDDYDHHEELHADDVHTRTRGKPGKPVPQHSY